MADQANDGGESMVKRCKFPCLLSDSQLGEGGRREGGARVVTKLMERCTPKQQLSPKRVIALFSPVAPQSPWAPTLLAWQSR